MILHLIVNCDTKEIHGLHRENTIIIYEMVNIQIFWCGSFDSHQLIPPLKIRMYSSPR